MPPFHSQCPLPAIGYLRGYLETHRPGISVTSAYWNQAFWKLARPYVEDPSRRSDEESYRELFDAVFARLYLLEAGKTRDGQSEGDSPIFAERKLGQSPAKRELGRSSTVEFLEKYGSLFLDSQPLEGLAALCDQIRSFLDAEAARLHLDRMDIIGASVMHRELIPALTFLLYAKRRFRTPLMILGGFHTARDAREIMTAFPFIDIGVFGDGEETLLEICDAWQDPAALQGLAGTVVRRGDRVIENPGRGYVHAPDMAPANYEGFDWNDPAESSLSLPICNARGCSWGKCSFCILNNRPPEEYSTRTPQSILDEVRQHLTTIRRTSQTTIQIHFLGNEVVGRRQGPAELAELLRGLVELNAEFGRLSLFGELSPADMTDEVACLLNRLDANLVLGFEQWSRVVKLARKRHRIIDGVQALKLFDRYPNLRFGGVNLLIGIPGETLIDVYETKSNLWRLKFLLAPLARRPDYGYLWGGPLKVISRTLGMMQVSIPPELCKRWDFQNPFVQENLAHRPWTILLKMMCGDEALATDYVSRNQFFDAYDTTATAGLQRRLVERLGPLLEECSIDAYRNPEGLLELLLVSGRHRLAVPLEHCLLRILHETRGIVSRAQLAERLADIPSDEVDEGIEFLEATELLYVSRGDARLINTLPARIQAEVDRAALCNPHTPREIAQQPRLGEENGSDESEYTPRAPRAEPASREA